MPVQNNGELGSRPRIKALQSSCQTKHADDKVECFSELTSTKLPQGDATTCKRRQTGSPSALSAISRLPTRHSPCRAVSLSQARSSVEDRQSIDGSRTAKFPVRPTIISRDTAANTLRQGSIGGGHLPAGPLAHTNRIASPPPTCEPSAIPTAGAVASPDTAKSSTLTLRSPRYTLASRTPLAPRDQNARLVTRHPSFTNPVTMPYERPPNTSRGSKPQTPSLSVAAQRGSNRSPLTPKIATQAQVPRTTGAHVHTPLATKTQHHPNSSMWVAGTSEKSGLRKTDEPPLLSSNVTPRSGSRQSRVDSAQSTPNGTPSVDRAEWEHDRAGLGISPRAFQFDGAKRPSVTFSSARSPNSNVQSRQETHHNSDSKFFHASDAKSIQHSAAPRPPLLKATSFFYANGTNLDEKSSSAPTLVQTQSENNVSTKFIYANGTPDLRPSPPGSTGRSSSIGSASKPLPSRPGLGSQVSGYPTTQRPVSPVKLAQSPIITQSRNADLPQLSVSKSPIASPPPLSSTPAGLRRSSTGASRRSGHSRSGSLVMAEMNLRSSISSEASTPAIASPTQHAPVTLASIVQAAEDFAENEESASPDDSHSDLHSPTKSAHLVDPVTELIASARRERKVQDLEITNASLEAINRTLERQLRKQTSELRRYQRLSRSGRLSIASGAMSSRVVSESISVDQSIDSFALPDLGEISEAEAQLDEDTSTDDESLSESLSPSVIAERDARRRKRDEKRLQLDLTKHQELLVDSQKINQSILRCLDFTEELIREGKRALEFTIRPSEVEIPRPRVLRPRDEDEETERTTEGTDDNDNDGDGSNLDSMLLLEDDELGTSWPRERPPRLATWGLQPLNRDSGIVIPNDGG